MARPLDPASASTTSCVASVVAPGSVNASRIGTTTSGAPEPHSLISATGGGALSTLPRGAPPVAHTSNRSVSRALSVSGCHGGVSLLSNSRRSDSAHGAASSKVMSDMGATPPSTWQRPQRSRTTGKTSSLK